jgi:hypothetical protein
MHEPPWSWHNDGPLVSLEVGVAALVAVLAIVLF